MQKCFYHAKTSAVTVCVGCKLPVCRTCSDEGQKGFCEACMKKAATIGAKAETVRQTVMARSAPAPEPARPAAGSRSCHQHPDLVASAGCVNCKRPFCPACLNTQGICAPCAQHSEAARARMNAPSDRAQRLAGSGVSAGASATAGMEAPGGRNQRVWFIAGIVAGALVLSGAIVAIKRPAPRPDAAAKASWQSKPLTAQEKALLAELEAEAKRAVPIADPPPDEPVRGADPAPVVRGVPAGAYAAPVEAPRRSRASRVRIGVASPRSGAVLSGMATITASVAGAPERVELYVDGQWQGAVDGPPYTFEWASQAVSNGRHRVVVEAIASDGRKASSGVTVTIRN